MGIDIVPVLKLTRLACCEVIGDTQLEMTHEGETSTEIDAQVGIFQTVLAELGIIDLVADGETELWTCSEIDSSRRTEADVITQVKRNLDRLLLDSLITGTR